MKSASFSIGFINKKHVLYFAALFLATVLLAAMHWEGNPYRLTVWINASDVGQLNIASRCEGQSGFDQKFKLPVVAGYFEYDVPLPKCRLDLIKISNADKHANHYEVSLP